MEEDVNLLPRDRLLRDNFTPAEWLLFGTILFTANVAFWLVDPRSNWLLGFFLIAAGLTPAILKTHEQTHPFFVTFLWPKFWLCSAPLWILLAQFVVGIRQDPIESFTFGKEVFIQLDPVNPWVPISTSSASNWLPLLGYGAIYLIAVNLFIIPKSRAFFERLLPWLCISASIVALFGYIQAGVELTSPLLTKGTGRSDFFGFFPYDGHWAAFAIIWTCVCMSMSLLVTRYDDSPAFIESAAPWYMTGGVLLGGSAFLVEAQWPAVLLLFTLSGMLLIVMLNFMTHTRDPHSRAISLLSGLASTAVFAAALFRIFQQPASSLDTDNLRQAAIDLFRESPIFGWGLDSFQDLLPFYGSDLLLGQNFERAGSDVLQLLAELGILGLGAPFILLVILVVRYFKGRHDIQLTNHLLLGCSGILVLAFLDTPFMSPAVFFSFFIVLFTGLRWADLTRHKVDEVDAPKPRLVTPETQRRVPYYNEIPKERFK